MAHLRLRLIGRLGTVCLIFLCRSIFLGGTYKELPQERPQDVLILTVVFCRENLVLSLAGDVEVALRPVKDRHPLWQGSGRLMPVLPKARFHLSPLLRCQGRVYPLYPFSATLGVDSPPGDGIRTVCLLQIKAETVVVARSTLRPAYAFQRVTIPKGVCKLVHHTITVHDPIRHKVFIKPRHSNTYYRTDQEYPEKLPLHPGQGRGLPQLAQNLPLFTVPHEQVHSSLAGLGWPHSAQNLPVFTAPQAHVHSPAGAGLG